MVAINMSQETNLAEGKDKSGLIASAKPVSCHLIEVDTLGNVFWSWSYPSSDNGQRTMCLRKLNAMRRTASKTEEVFKFFRFRSSWYYAFLSEALSSYENNSGKLPKVDQVGVLVEADDFNPERYQIVTEVLFRTYFKQEDPTVVLQQFLSLVVSGTCQLPKKKLFSSSDYDTATPFADFQLKAMISKFGVETIVLLTAVVRKQRIVVYHHDIDILVRYTLSIPGLGPVSPTMWNDVYPWVGFHEDELADFTNSNFHIFGCPKASIESRNDLFDVFVNIPAGEINVVSRAKEKMMMSKPHKEMALFMVQLAANSDISECDMVEEIRTKIRDLAIDTH